VAAVDGIGVTQGPWRMMDNGAYATGQRVVVMRSYVPEGDAKMATVDGGITIRLLPRTVYSFGGSTGLTANGSASFLVARHFDLSVFTEADLLVRAHAGSAIGVLGGTFVVQAMYEGYDFQDPAADFLQNPSPAGNVSMSNSTTFPFFAVVSIPSPFGRHLAVQVTATQAGSTNAALTVALSVDLALKGGDPTAMSLAPNTYRGYQIL
jgi:hypothetical protein